MDRVCRADRDFVRLERLIRAELDDVARSEAESHLAACAICTAERGEILRDRAVLTRAVATPETVHAARAHEILAEVRSGERDSRWKLSAVAVAAVAMAAVSTALVVSRDPTEVAGRGPASSRDALGEDPHLLPPPLPGQVGPDATHRLPDGTMVRTASSGVAVVVSQDLVEVFGGEVEFTVARRRVPFEVDAPGLRVTVHGTQFTVATGPGGTTVRVTEGEVDVRRLLGHDTNSMASSYGSPVLVRAGETYPPSPTRRGRAAPIDVPDALAEAREHLTARRYVEARAALERHLATRPADLDARYLLGEAQRLGGDMDAAEATYERLVSSGGGRVAENALARLALIGQRRGPEAGVAAWQRYLTKHPRGTFAAEGALHRANGLVSLGRRDEARGVLEQFLRDFPDHPRRAEVEERIRTGR